MPTYEFVCDKCKTKREVNRPMSEAGEKTVCTCGATMRRVFSFGCFTVPLTGRDIVIKTINKEEGGHKFPGGDMHHARYAKAMAKGLDPPKQVIGRGF